MRAPKTACNDARTIVRNSGFGQAEEFFNSASLLRGRESGQDSKSASVASRSVAISSVAAFRQANITLTIQFPIRHKSLTIALLAIVCMLIASFPILL